MQDNSHTNSQFLLRDKFFPIHDLNAGEVEEVRLKYNLITEESEG